MTTIEKTTESFYVTGGTLRRDAACYVQRKADQALYDGLMQGNFCYVLTSRQMGKSSLMVRTAARLREEGTNVAVLDLTSIGQNLNAEQWYDGLLSRLGRQFHLEDELEDFWTTHSRLSPLQRWMNAICAIVLPHLPGRIIIFVDEIDAVRSLPFSTDEFFAAIRELYNRRTEDAELERLTFCLLGVASPSDLIRDTRTTPFNIGRRIELNDFTDDEAAPLARGMGRDDKTAAKLLNRILYWTGGHPYLTQRLCQAVAKDAHVHDAGSVDWLCEELFFTTRARERDDNLLFVRERMLKSEADRAALLDLYKKLRDHKRIKDDETNPLVSVLRLSGITRVAEGLLYVRNRIYYRVFDREWVLANLPDAEVFRQRAAYRRGLLRAAAVAAVIVTALGALSFVAIRQRNRAVESDQANRRLLYTAQMNLAGQDWEDGNIGRMREALNAHIPLSGQEDIRGFEWFYLWRLIHKDMVTLDTPKPRNMRLSNDRKILAIVGPNDDTITLWDTDMWKKLHTLKALHREVFFLAFSPDNKRLYSQGYTGKLKIWNLVTGQEVRTVELGSDDFRPLECSPDGKQLAIGRNDGRVSLRDASTGQELIIFQMFHPPSYSNFHFSPDGKYLIAACGSEGLIKIWDVTTGKESRSFKIKVRSSGYTTALSPDGRKLAFAEESDSVKLIELTSGKAFTLNDQMNQRFWYSRVAFSPDGNKLAASSDKYVLVWDIKTEQRLQVFTKQWSTIRYVAFLSAGKRLLSQSENSEMQVWKLDSETMPEPEVIRGAEIAADVIWAPDGNSFAVAEKGGAIIIREPMTGRELTTLKNSGAPNPKFAPESKIAFSIDGQRITSIDEQNLISVWEIKTRKVVNTFMTKIYMTGLFPAFSPDGNQVVVSDDANTMKVWDVNSGKELLTVKGQGISKAALSPSGKLLAVTEFNSGVIKLFDFSSGKEISTLKGPFGNWSVGFSPDGEQLAAGTISGDLSLWEVKTGRQIFTAQGHARGVISLSFTPDGNRIATGGFDNKVKIWDSRTGQELLTLTGHTEVLKAVAFSPDGKMLLSASRDKTVRIWRAATEAEVQARRGQ